MKKGPTSWRAFVPDLPGIAAVAGTGEEVELQIQEAIRSPLKGMRAQGVAIPTPSIFAGVVEIDTAT
jgi:predicted RNase H-like HicB family nuclease